MKVLLVQTDIIWGDSNANMSQASSIIAGSVSADLIVLPEMFTTGFCTSPRGVAEPSETDALKWMQQTAQMKNAAIAASVAVVNNGKYYNRFYFVKPDQTYDYYDKRHLFTYGGEDKAYTAGEDRVIVEYKGFRILLLVCYDLRFPVWSRNRSDYDLILYVANWPTSRLTAWDTLLRARAIENQCYVVGVNRTGEDPSSQYSGGTVLLDFFGKTIVECDKNKECTVTGDIYMNELISYRDKFPALRDADSFNIIK